MILLDNIRKWKYNRRLKKNRNINIEYDYSKININIELLNYIIINDNKEIEDISSTINGEEVLLHKSVDREDINNTYTYLQDDYNKMNKFTYLITMIDNSNITQELISVLSLISDNMTISKKSLLVSLSVKDMYKLQYLYSNNLLDKNSEYYLLPIINKLNSDYSKSSNNTIESTELYYDDLYISLSKYITEEDIDIMQKSITSIGLEEYDLYNHIYLTLYVKNYNNTYNNIINNIINYSSTFTRYIDEENIDTYELSISYNSMNKLIKEELQNICNDNEFIEHLTMFYNIMDQDLSSNTEEYIKDPYDDIDEII